MTRKDVTRVGEAPCLCVLGKPALLHLLLFANQLPAGPSNTSSDYCAAMATGCLPRATQNCVKGYYKRAKAHAAVWNEKEARRDFNMVAHLDPTLASLVHRELRALSERMKEKYWQEKDAYWNKLDVKDAADEKEKKESVDEEEKKDAQVGDEGGKDDGGDKTEGKDWQQMLRLVMLLQEQGNVLMKEKGFQEASTKFKEALDYVDFLQNKQVRRGDEDWESLEKVRLPLTLNLSQCMLELQRYPQVVQLSDKLLESHQGHFKALYQRARAHAALCNEEEARKDFAAVEKLDPQFKPVVRQELKKLGENLRSMHAHQNKTYWLATQEKLGPREAQRKKFTRELGDSEEQANEIKQSCKTNEENSDNENTASAEVTTDPN